MPLYRVSIKLSTGEDIEEEIEADSPDQLSAKVRENHNGVLVSYEDTEAAAEAEDTEAESADVEPGSSDAAPKANSAGVSTPTDPSSFEPTGALGTDPEEGVGENAGDASQD